MKKSSITLILFSIVYRIRSFSIPARGRYAKDTTVLSMGLFDGRPGVSKLPTKANRDKQAIESIKAAINKPKTKSYPLIECEFPPLTELNKLGDGSLRSANQVNDANLAFSLKLVRSLAFPIFGQRVIVLMGSGASKSNIKRAKATFRTNAVIGSLRDGIPPSIRKGDVIVIISPSSSQDYQAANKMASQGIASGVVLVNGFSKDQKSVNESATMAYYLKPLTYNSQVVGYLVRNYPNKWTTFDLLTKRVLGSYDDKEILFGKTNTPDLRDPGRLVQKCVDERAILSRKNK